MEADQSIYRNKNTLNLNTAIKDDVQKNLCYIIYNTKQKDTIWTVLSRLLHLKGVQFIAGVIFII